MRASLGALALLVVSAGCISGPQESAPEALAPVEAGVLLPHRLGMAGCEDHVGLVLIPMAADPIAMPDGFKQAPMDPAGTLGAHANMGYRCGPVEGAAALEGAMGYQASVLVDPPDAYEAEGIDWYAVPIVAWWSGSEELAAVFRAWGVQALGAQGSPPSESAAASVEMTATEAWPVGRVGEVRAASGGASVAMTTLGRGEGAAMPEGKGRFFVLRDGAVTGAVDYAYAASTTITEGNPVWRFAGFGALPPPVVAGQAIFQSWGEDYAFEWTHVPLAPGETSNARDPGMPRMHGVPLDQAFRDAARSAAERAVAPAR